MRMVVPSLTSNPIPTYPLPGQPSPLTPNSNTNPPLPPHNISQPLTLLSSLVPLFEAYQ